MNEDWLNKVHDRLSDFEIDEPENLWESLESKLTVTSAEPARKKKPVILLWAKRAVAVAAVIAVAVTVGFYLFTDKAKKPEAVIISSVTEEAPRNKSAVGYNSDEKSQTDKSSLRKSTPDKFFARHNAQDNIADISAPISATETEKKSTADSNNENSGSATVPESTDNSSEKKEPEVKEPYPSIYDNKYSVTIPAKAPSDSRLSVSIYSSGGTSSTLNTNSKGAPVAGVTGPGESNWEDNPMLGILTFNQGKDIETDIKHRLPIRAGVSFTYNFTERLGLETGLSYTYLASDIKEGGKSHYYTGEQKLHYIGIPLNLKYRLLSWKRFDFYTSAGMLAEKCVSAKLDKKFVLGNQTKGPETENLPEKPMQWSVNASVGVQCNLVRAMSMFVEPGISYYFDDGTDINTIYKDKPLSFNLSMGLRFTFGK